MLNLFDEIKQKSRSNKNEMVDLLSQMISIGRKQGGTSSKEGDRAKLMLEILKNYTEHTFIDDFGNVIGGIGEMRNPSWTIWLIGHLDTVSSGEWGENAYNPKIEGNKLFGRGSSDQLSGVVSSMICLKILNNYQKTLKARKIRVLVMGNPHEEDCEGESIKYLIGEVQNKTFPDWILGLPNVVFSTEPSSTESGIPRPYFGHRGRYLYKLEIKGETGHGAIPIQIPAAELFSRTVSNIFTHVKGAISQKFGADTFAFTTGELLSPSHNAHTENIRWNIDLRIAPLSSHKKLIHQMEIIAENIRKEIATEKNVNLISVPCVKFDIVKPVYKTYNGYEFIGSQALPGPWLSPNHPLRNKALKTYRDLFGHVPPYDKNKSGSSYVSDIEGDCSIRDFYNFSTDLTGLIQLIKKSDKYSDIAYMGLGSGIEEQAHRKFEWCPINSLVNACAYYLSFILT